MVLRRGDLLYYSVGFHGLIRDVDYRLLTAGFVGRRHYGKSAYTSRLRLTDRDIPTGPTLYHRSIKANECIYTWIYGQHKKKCNYVRVRMEIVTGQRT